ncbi:hypothetical protein GLOTRDRAFT_123047 [Gloeophyllum trabeum ATCC 11539]|uniref:Uncharacterized protein n=1 Tax=Gloeophyllum trabeum (strain ATCC 11539 / FP-39264 / Madison 617) TaxID=670483 RepID=S7PWJ5_GLOTA|nr:uncharacterized protein GLOTRDRAFT_123047 [Gloeophyllum trabeum ATCC 11539]EPQ51928.1 hypothetical protein GLOTRDRAFT_123047 [Gloeophyllum trabeum ATCC 11539]
MAAYDPKAAQDDLRDHFDGYASNVRRSFIRFEEQYARPVVEACISSSRERPAMSALGDVQTFVAIFVLLSVLPVVTFMQVVHSIMICSFFDDLLRDTYSGFSLFTIASAAFLAFVVQFSHRIARPSDVAIASILLATLTILFFTALFLASAVIVMYLTVRLAILVRSDGVRPGFVAWRHEAQKGLLGRASDNVEGGNGGKTREEDEGSESSGVIVPKQDELGQGIVAGEKEVVEAGPSAYSFVPAICGSA